MTVATLVVSSAAAERATYGAWLRAGGWRVEEVATPADAIDRQQQAFFPLTLADVTGNTTAGDFVEAIHRVRPQAEMLVVVDNESVATAVSAMRAGAGDLLLKPLERDALLQAVQRFSQVHVALAENERLRRELQRRFDFSRIVAHSPAMLRVLTLASRVAERDTTVLITGESGTGKEVLARAIHANSSRHHRGMLSLNCATVPETLVESELFGYRRGAFTGADADKLGLLGAADGGTLFLDEIGELPLSAQAKLLRVLQDGTYFRLGSTTPEHCDVRIIAATNAPVPERVEAGTFRRDLYYRLSVFPLHIPPLRERPEDVVPLAYHFLRDIGHELGKDVPGLSRDAVTKHLTSRTWPGNARELQNAIARAVILCDGNLLTSNDFTMLDPVFVPWTRADTIELPERGIDLPALNRRLVEQAMERANQNVSAAARLLGISRATLRYRLQKQQRPASEGGDDLD